MPNLVAPFVLFAAVIAAPPADPCPAGNPAAVPVPAGMVLPQPKVLIYYPGATPAGQVVEVAPGPTACEFLTGSPGLPAPVVRSFFLPGKGAVPLAGCGAGHVFKAVATAPTAGPRPPRDPVTVECRVLTVPAGFGAGHLFKAAETGGDGPTAVLTPAEVDRLLAAAMRDRRSQVLQMPALTLASGDTAERFVGDVAQFVTGLDIQVRGLNTVAVPKTRTEKVGTAVKVHAAVDGKAVRVRFEARQTEVDPTAPMFPVTYPVTPVFEGGSQGPPVPVTQLVQNPSVKVMAAGRDVAVPAGGTVAAPLGTRTAEAPTAVTKVPYLNLLFRPKAGKPVTEEVIVLVTANAPAADKAGPVVVAAAAPDDAPCCKAAGPAAAKSPAAGHVAAYRKACAAGRTEEAMKHALQALAADPGCFAGAKDKAACCCDKGCCDKD